MSAGVYKFYGVDGNLAVFTREMRGNTYTLKIAVCKADLERIRDAFAANPKVNKALERDVERLRDAHVMLGNARAVPSSRYSLLLMERNAAVEAVLRHFPARKGER